MFWFEDTRMRLCPNVSTTHIKAMGCLQCLPLSVVQLKGKHCPKPHYHNGVVYTFWLWMSRRSRLKSNWINMFSGTQIQINELNREFWYHYYNWFENYSSDITKDSSQIFIKQKWSSLHLPYFCKLFPPLNSFHGNYSIY